MDDESGELQPGTGRRTPVLGVQNLWVEYSLRRAGLGASGKIAAVAGIDLEIGQQEVLALVGESGCGKSTLARTVVGIQKATAGTVYLDGQPVGDQRSSQQRRKIQMVFQDAQSSLNPRMTVGQTLTEVIRAHRMRPKEQIPSRVDELMHLVHLPARLVGSRPRALSGGQRQRVGIARALALEPQVLVADEPVSALDVSVQAAVLNLLMDLRASLGLSVLFISHNLAAVRQVADRVAVMYLGRVVEIADADRFFLRPAHPYSAALLTAVPRLGVPGHSAPALAGDPPGLADKPRGCPFRSRCAIAQEDCIEQVPVLSAAPGAAQGVHLVACHHPVGGPPSGPAGTFSELDKGVGDNGHH